MKTAQEIVNELGAAFEAFKAEHSAQIAAIKAQRPDALIEEKITRINADLNELSKIKGRLETMEARSSLPAGGGGDNSELGRAKAEHRKAFNKFIRKGAEDGLRDLSIQAALTTQSDPDGGYTVNEEIDTAITRVLTDMTVMRQIATVRSVGSAVYKKIHNTGGATAGWVGEEQSRSETSTPALKELEFPTKELYAMPYATQQMLDDSSFNIEAWLADEVGIVFNEYEEDAFITGTGILSPRGFQSYTMIANASYTWGKIGFIVSGAAADFASSNPSDKLIDMVHALKPGYRSNGTWLTNDLTLSSIRKFKEATTNAYIWQPGLQLGQPDVLLGKPVVTSDSMPDVAANAFPLAFGDFRRGYVITDRMGVRVLRDPYTSKPYVKFYTTKRVGGGVQDFAAIKVMKMST